MSPSHNTRQRVCVLGSTGSIGVSTLDVIARHPDRFEVFALTGASRTGAAALRSAARHRGRRESDHLFAARQRTAVNASTVLVIPT